MIDTDPSIVDDLDDSFSVTELNQAEWIVTGTNKELFAIRWFLPISTSTGASSMMASSLPIFSSPPC